MPDRRWALRILVVAALLAGGALLGAGGASGEELVTVVSGTTSAQLPPEASAVATFPIEPAADVDLNKVIPLIVRLRRDTVEIPNEVTGTDSVTADVDPAVPAIRLTVAADRLDRQGSYEVLVALSFDGRRQLLTFTLTRADGALSAPDTIKVERTVWFPDLPWDVRLPVVKLGLSSQKKPLLRVEAGRDTRLTGISAAQAEAEEGSVEAHPPAGPLEPGKPATVPYDLTGELPLGSITRTVELKSPQLAQPVKVTFEITTRRHRVLIPVLLLFGVVAGALVRVVIPKLLRGVRVRRQALELISQLDALREEYKDERFRQALDEAMETLRALPGKAADAEQAVAAARTAATTALEDLSTRIATQDARYVLMAPTFEREWQLPTGLAELAHRARGDLAVADERLDRHDAKGARLALDEVRATADDVASRAQIWLIEYCASLADLKDAGGQRTDGALGALVQTITVRLARLPKDGPAGDDDEPQGEEQVVTAARESLRAVHQAVDGHASVASAIGWVADEMDQVADIVEAMPGTTPLVADLRRGVAELRTAYGRRPDPVAGLRLCKPALTAAVAAAVATIRAPLQSTTVAEVESAIGRGDLLGATREMLDRLPAATVGDTATRLGSAPSALAAAGTAATAATAAGGPAAEPGTVLPARRPRVVTRIQQGPVAFALGVVSALALLAQALIAAVVIVIVGYPLFAANWTGTLSDMAKVVSWAFAINLSVEGVLTLAKQGAGAPAGQ